MAENMNTFGVGTTDTLKLDDLNTTLVEDKEVDELPEEEVENNEVDVVEETPIVETPKPKKVEPKKPSWEIKDRLYYLKGSKKPISYMLRTSNIYWFDQDTNEIAKWPSSPSLSCLMIIRVGILAG